MSFLTFKEYEEIGRKLKFNTKALIDGKLVSSKSGKTIVTENPANGQKITEFACCDVEDVDIAVKAARKAFEDGRWSGLKASQRKEILLKYADLIMKNLDALAVMESMDSGKPIFDTLQSDVPETAACFVWHAEAEDKLEDKITTTGPDNLSLVVREPLGVVGAVLPWNFPILMAGWKVAPILASGNCAVVKPAALTSLTMLKLAELALEAGIPEGVLNIVPGKGSTVGTAIALHPDINMITFTGSTEVGKKLLEYSGQSNIKRVLLELGGKNPCIVLPDYTDLDTAAEQIVTAALWNMGENCTQNSRIYVPRNMKDKFLEKIIQETEKWKVGNPLDSQNRQGALIEKSHMERILYYIEKGKAEGAKLVYGGYQTLQETGGYFIKPAIFDNMTQNMVIARDEIFGPVFGVIAYDSVDEAIAMANDTQYGLQASLWSNDLNSVHKVTRKIQAGTISVNCFSEGDIHTPFGGFKQSGFFGRDKSLFANEQYKELKTIWMQLR